MTIRPRPGWRKRLLQVFGMLLLVGLAAHPEMIHLGALLDALGLDTVVLLLEVQVLAGLGLAYQWALRPIGGWLWRHALEPLVRSLAARAQNGVAAMLLRASDAFWVNASGPVGQYLYLQLRCRVRMALACR